MILFKEDFEQQGAIADYGTKNKSFIRYAYQLKQMGIGNHSFVLALYDRGLQGLDPHNLPNNSLELRLRVIQECKTNFWYFIREVVRIPQTGQSEIGWFEASRANIALAWVFLNNIVPFLTMPRQRGKTIAAITITAWCYLVAGVRIQIGMFAKDDDLVQENVDRLKTIRDGLPSYMVSKIYGDKENQNAISYTKLENKYYTYKPQTSITRARGLSRGRTFAWEHWDELPYFKFNYHSYPAAMATVATGQPLARASGLRCANIITTTAGMLDTKEGAFANNIRTKAMRFNEKFYDYANEKRLREIVYANSENRTVYMEFSYKQLGADDEWLEMMASSISDPNTYATDVLNQWIHGSGANIFPKHLLEELQKNKKEPVEHTMFETLVNRWYTKVSHISKDTPIILGIDPSDNVGKDFTTLVAEDPRDMGTIMTCRTNSTNLTYVAYCVVELMIKYPRLLLVVERNKGQFLIDLVMTRLKAHPEGHRINPFRRIFNVVVQEYGDENATEDKRINIDKVDPHNSTMRRHFGFWTGGGKNGSRKFLFGEVMQNSIPRNKERIHDSDIIDEVCSLTVRNGRIDHPEGGKDDTLVARLLCDYVILYGKNLHMYGFAPEDVLSVVDDSGDVIDPNVKLRELQIKARVNELQEKMGNTFLPEAVRDACANELRHLMPLVNMDAHPTEIISISQLGTPKEPKAMRKADARTIFERANLLQTL